MTANQEIQFEAMRKYMLERYAAELSDKLYYHGVHHVLDVEASVMRIAASLSLTDRELLLLRTAAIFHDYGFIESPHQHEERSCSVAGTLLPDYGYSPSDIATICGMIMATELPQQPQSMLEMIIADADLDYLGRDDYPEIADSLYRELHHQGRVFFTTTRLPYNMVATAQSADQGSKAFAIAAGAGLIYSYFFHMITALYLSMSLINFKHITSMYNFGSITYFSR
jgi:uncharacterized protein